MKIYTLGTSHGDATVTRFNSSTLYAIKDNLYLVDCGEPVTALMIRKGFDFNKLKAVFITHMHADHAGGLICLIKHLIKHCKKEEKIKIFFPEDGIPSLLLGWLKALHLTVDSDRIGFDLIKPGEFYNDGILSASGILTRHMDYLDVNIPSYALDIKAEGKRVLHTGDLKGDFSDFPSITLNEEFDACLCEATHYKMEKAVELLMKAKLKRMIFIHIKQMYHFKEGETLLFDECNRLPYSFFIAHDGDEFNI